MLYENIQNICEYVEKGYEDRQYSEISEIPSAY